MNVMIINETKTQTSHYLTLSAGNKSIFIGKSASSLTVCVDNASHRAFRGVGKVFHGGDCFEKALENYKSSEVRAAIRYAMDVTA